MRFQKQKGVALVVGLMMLLVLTIMGISSMSNTTTELKIACNYQTHNDAFQAANSAVEYAISQTKPGAAFPLTFSHEVKDSNAKVDMTVDLLGCQRITGGSLKVAAYENVYAVDSISTAVGCGGEAFSHIVQAIAIKIPKSCAED